MSNADLFAKCNIHGIETFLMQSQLRWAGHVVIMSDERMPKALLYSQLQSGGRRVGRPLLRYKDKLKSNLTATHMSLSTFEKTASDRKQWRLRCHNALRKFESERVQKLRDSRERRNELAARPTDSRFLCTACEQTCRSLAGLRSHERHKHRN